MKEGLKKIVIYLVAIALTGALFFGVMTLRYGKNDELEDALQTRTTEENDETVNILVMGTDRQAGLCDVMMY